MSKTSVVMTLREEDRRAVDLLLDRGSAASAMGVGMTAFAHVDGASQDRVRSAQQILNMLDLLPQADPPQDLLSRTMERVDGSRSEQFSPARVAGHGLMSAQGPVA